ncbi:putative serine dehydratase domain-containing protein [Rostrohypoxylon terebratum]|nr:putative serine dehydratase domain-containing protein [Rostrohypoxylon terebratum]
MDTLDQRIARKAKLESLYVGKDIEVIPKPAVVLDVSKARRHCSSMLAATKALGVGFRPHVKTHKTVELTKLQIGDDTSDVKLVVSTVSEIEHILPLLQDLIRGGRRINVLYGLPLPPSQVDRVAKIARRLGPESISFMIDHLSQVESLRRFSNNTGFPGGVFIKVDTGYHRAGLPPKALNANGLVEAVTRLHLEGKAKLVGLYSHSSLSYQGKSPEEAMDNLTKEIRGCIDAVIYNHQCFANLALDLTVSVGASPQVTSIQNFMRGDQQGNGPASGLMRIIQNVSSEGVSGIKISLELHAGVYSVLDLQQLSTHSRTSMGRFDEEIAISVAAEVVSIYSDGERQNPEALVAVGTLGLGREPCHSYDGWGIVGSLPALQRNDPERRRLVVKRISQEHSIVSWDTKDDELGYDEREIPLEVGQYVRIYPNHACITGAMYDWYFVVDSSSAGDATKVVDIWMRALGW